MVRVKDLAEVKDEEDWWGDLKEESLWVVRRLMESAMEEELLEQLRAGRYRRSGLRRGYRNGYRHRDLLTEMGMLESFSRRTGTLGPGRPVPTYYHSPPPAASREGERAGVGYVPARGEHQEGGGGAETPAEYHP